MVLRARLPRWQRGGDVTMSIKRLGQLTTVVVGASVLLAGVVSASPADPDPVPPATRLPDDAGPLIRGWRFTEYVTDLQAVTEVDSGSDIGRGPLDERYDFSPQTVNDPNGWALGMVESGPDGSGFMVYSEVPDDGLGNRAEFVSYQAFRKDADDARLAYAPSQARLLGVDRNGTELLEQECDEPTMTNCPGPIGAELYLDVALYTADELLFRSAGGVMLTGWNGNWEPSAWTEGYATSRMWG
jgi:hypothetical protein